MDADRIVTAVSFSHLYQGYLEVCTAVHLQDELRIVFQFAHLVRAEKVDHERLRNNGICRWSGEDCAVSGTAGGVTSWFLHDLLFVVVPSAVWVVALKLLSGVIWGWLLHHCFESHAARR